MEVIKKNIHMNHIRGKAGLEITLDDDFIVPDVKPDIYKKVKEQGTVITENVKTADEKIGVAGKLDFKLLYITDGGNCPVCCMEGSIPFDETINMSSLEPQDMVKCQCTLEDLSINVINSRKISVKALISIEVTAETIVDCESAIDIEDDNVQFLKKNMSMLQMVVNKKDIFRIKELVELPSNKPNVSDMIWYDIDIRNTDIRPCDGGINVKGEMFVFFMYTGEDNSETINYSENIIPFTGNLEVGGCNDEMMPDVCISIADRSLQIKPDYDGELRVAEVEMVLDLDIKVYEEQSMQILDDVYCPRKNLKPVRKETEYEMLLVKNSSKCKCGNKFKLNDDNGTILQICNSSGMVKLEDEEITDSGIRVDGLVTVNVLYIKADDKEKIGSTRFDIPFTHEIDVNNINNKAIFSIKTVLEQLTCAMTGSGEIEIKCVVGLETLAFMPMKENLIQDIDEEEPDYDAMKNMPGIVGYIVGDGDTLWNIAKKYYTTTGDIMKVNDMTSDKVKPGMKLLLVKK